MDPIIFDAIIEALRVLFLLSAPLVAAVAFGGLIASILQASMAINEPALNYGVKLLVFLLVLYFLFPTIAQSLLSLAERAYQ